MPRTLSPYEYNHLLRHGVDPAQINEHGEKPVEYITGHVTFNNHDFLVTEDTLIPRVETEELVALAVAEIQQIQQRLQNPTQKIVIADVGTGSGAIALSIILELLSQPQPESLHLEFWMSDISRDALKVAEQNISRLIPEMKNISPGLYSLHSQATHTQITVHVLESNVLSNFPPSQIDLLLANLPYIPSQRISVLDSSVKDYEPHVALDGGDQGLDLIHTLLDQAAAYLSDSGKIILEVDYTHTPAEITTDERWKVRMLFDNFQRQRFAVVTHA